MTTAVVTGGDGLLARRVMELLSEPDDRVDTPGRDPIEIIALETSLHPASIGAAGPSPLDDAAGAVDIVIDLGAADHDRRAERRESASEFAAATLAAADRLGATHVVFVSSAMVYGASPNNPKPLTEEAVLRPDVEFVFARQLASAEEMVEQWRRARSARVTSVLRPCLTLAPGRNSNLATALVSGLGRRFADADPPAQFLHIDDLAEAVAIAVRRRLDGVFNVAPDGWVAGERVRALSGERPRLPLPERLSESWSGVRWRFLRGPIPPGLGSYTREPWVVANGRLRAQGWDPIVTNEQAYVEATEAPWWTLVSPKRRQELALGVGVVAGLGLIVAAVAAARRWHRHRGA